MDYDCEIGFDSQKNCEECLKNYYYKDGNCLGLL